MIKHLKQLLCSHKWVINSSTRQGISGGKTYLTYVGLSCKKCKKATKARCTEDIWKLVFPDDEPTESTSLSGVSVPLPEFPQIEFGKGDSKRWIDEAQQELDDAIGKALKACADDLIIRLRNKCADLDFDMYGDMDKEEDGDNNENG